MARSGSVPREIAGDGRRNGGGQILKAHVRLNQADGAVRIKLDVVFQAVEVEFRLVNVFVVVEIPFDGAGVRILLLHLFLHGGRNSGGRNIRQSRKGECGSESGRKYT